jgi:hypothetical protein
MAVFSNKNSFCQRSHATSFCTKTNLRENRFFAGEGRLADKKCSHRVKFPTKKRTFLIDELMS